MFKNPKENSIHTNCILMDQFRRKGYNCQEVKEKDSTILILKHQQKNMDSILQAIAKTIKAN